MIVKNPEVTTAYNEDKHLAQRQGKSLSIKNVAETCHVNWHFVQKIKDKLIVHGRVLPLSEGKDSNSAPRGTGLRTLNALDQYVLL